MFSWINSAGRSVAAWTVSSLCCGSNYSIIMSCKLLLVVIIKRLIWVIFKPIQCMEVNINLRNLSGKTIPHKYWFIIGEFSSDHPTIILFWKILHKFTSDQRRKLLKFVTSCSRPPLLGFKVISTPTGSENIKLTLNFLGIDATILHSTVGKWR